MKPLGELKGEYGGVIGGPHGELFFKEEDEGKDMITIYNEKGESVGFFEDWSWLPTGPMGPTGESWT